MDINVNESDFATLHTLIEEYAERFKSLLVSKLESSGRRATGQLIDNIQTVVKVGSDYYEVTLQAADYIYYTDNGRRAGKFPPVNKIEEWIEAKPILPTADSNGKLPTTKQLAYLIGMKIAREGYEGTHDVAHTVEELNAQYLPLLQQALEKDFETYWTVKVMTEVDKALKNAFLIK